MKKVISLVLVLVIMLGCVGLTACGGEKGEGVGTTPPTNGEPTAPAEKETPSSGGGLTWNDMPVYPGANQITKGTWTIPPAEEGDYSKVEWRYYETGDSASDVAAFYKSQMPSKGWEEIGWMEMQDMSWGIYNKNNEEDAAMVWTGSGEEGKTVIALMRATK
jgi:hypothetical protein